MTLTQKRTVGAVVAVAVLAVLAWFVLLRDTAPPPVTLDDAASQVADTPSESPTASENATAEPSPEPLTAAEVPGTWRIDTTVGDGDVDAGSFAGYRVQEELRNVGAVTATGRSPSLEGQIEIEGDLVTAVDVVVDMTQLRSDKGFRDGAIATRGIEYNTFPTAEFHLTEPIQLPENHHDGTPFGVDAVGELTLHGVTQPVTIPLEAQVVGRQLVVVGSLDIVMADYDITPPKAGPVVSISDEGVMELQLFLQKA